MSDRKLDPAEADGWIQTFSGRVMYPLAPQASMVCIEDVAHALAHQCRFTGHVRTFYSVAEHSVRASWVVSYSDQLDALLHDATEAYLTDLASPVKRDARMAVYRDAEAVMELAVRAAFGLPGTTHGAAVGFADRVMLSTEARDLLGPAPRLWTQDLPKPLPGRITSPLSGAWDPQHARERFLARYAELVLGRGFVRLYGQDFEVKRCPCCTGAVALCPPGFSPVVRALWVAVSAACAMCGGDVGHTRWIGASAPEGSRYDTKR